MYRNDQRTVITLDAGGTNFVFGAMRANKFIVELKTGGRTSAILEFNNSSK